MMLLGKQMNPIYGTPHTIMASPPIFVCLVDNWSLHQIWTLPLVLKQLELTHKATPYVATSSEVQVSGCV